MNLLISLKFGGKFAQNPLLGFVDIFFLSKMAESKYLFVNKNLNNFCFVPVSVEMVRRKAEHNDKEIGTLEELSLHQENILKIDHIQNWCRRLQILLLQSNLIAKIGKKNC